MQIGKRHWAIAGGHIPLHSTGEEPKFVGQDRLSLLNTGDQDVKVKLRGVWPMLNSLYFNLSSDQSIYR